MSKTLGTVPNPAPLVSPSIAPPGIHKPPPLPKRPPK
jgi:hypothetical protein